MKLPILSLLALASAPLAVQSWSMIDLFYPDEVLVLHPSAMLERKRALADRMLLQTVPTCQQKNAQISPLESLSPRYDLIDDEAEFQLSIDVPGIKMEDIDISLEEAGSVLTIRGQRVSAADSSKLLSKFSQSFSIDPTVDIDKFSATLDHGVLIVKAPKDLQKLEESVRKIPVTMLGGAESSNDDTAIKMPASSLKSTEEDNLIDLDKVDEKKKGVAQGAVEVKRHGDEDVKDKELMGGEF